MFLALHINTMLVMLDYVLLLQAEKVWNKVIVLMIRKVVCM